MQNKLIFYTNPRSRGQIIRWMLEEVGLPYETKIIEYGAQMKGLEYLAINPMGKVPAINHNGTIITECAAICTYLADAFPQAGLAPELNDKSRGTYLRWMFFAAGPLEAAVVNNSLGLVIPDDKKGMVGYGNFEDTLNAAEYALSNGPYILGDKFSAVDIYFGSQIVWGLQFGTIPTRKTFEKYSKLLMSREHSIKAKQIDAALFSE